MDATSILSKLESREPLFTSLPDIPRRDRRIIGTESEYGVATETFKAYDIKQDPRLPMVLWNGGEFYCDLDHLEYAAPESADPVSAVAFYEAGKEMAWRRRFSPKLYCHNNDWNGGSFGAHENYFTCAPRSDWHRLDWVAKLMLINEFREQEKSIVSKHGWVLHSQDMEYHSLNHDDPDKALYYCLRPQMERIVNDEVIALAVIEPPRNTRAYARGKLVQYLGEQGSMLRLSAGNWDELSIVPNDGRELFKGFSRGKPGSSLFVQKMPNPATAYHWQLHKLKRKLRKRNI